jgi:hypothetical protein
MTRSRSPRWIDLCRAQLCPLPSLPSLPPLFFFLSPNKVLNTAPPIPRSLSFPCSPHYVRERDEDLLAKMGEDRAQRRERPAKRFAGPGRPDMRWKPGTSLLLWMIQLPAAQDK